MKYEVEFAIVGEFMYSLMRRSRTQFTMTRSYYSFVVAVVLGR